MKRKENYSLSKMRDPPQTLAFVFLRLNGVIFGAIWTFHFDPMAKIRSETQHWKKLIFGPRGAPFCLRGAQTIFSASRGPRVRLWRRKRRNFRPRGARFFPRAARFPVHCTPFFKRS
ncbi:MAG: hypothetical protein EOP45_11230 [Sphingobacteriaceae bacterium]|nr:MAG: hypothetical protein EOP45_11230 [Sphingobacteriaceae bacterium]